MTRFLDDRERRNAEPESQDLTDPNNLWDDGGWNSKGRPNGTGMVGRVSDAADLRHGEPSPWCRHAVGNCCATAGICFRIAGKGALRPTRQRSDWGYPITYGGLERAMILNKKQTSRANGRIAATQLTAIG